METINKQQNNKTINLTLNHHITPVPQANTPKHRNIFTAKLKPRPTLFSGKGFRPTSNISSFHAVQPNQTYQQKLSEDQPILDEASLNQFSDLNLQDFLKVVIVGKGKLSQAKSKQIIRSLNGTWFRNTQTNHPVSRLYCSLPIKKQKSALMNKKSQDLLAKSNVDQFYKDYTPPNLFPKRKIGSIKISSPQIRQEYTQTNKQILEGDQIKGKILKKFTLLRQKTPESRNKRRSSSHFSKGKHSALNFFEEKSECLMGKKMVIHD